MFGSSGSLLGSQGFSLGGGYASGPSQNAGSPERQGKRPEDQQSTLPATVRLVEDALEAGEQDGEFRYHGRTAGQLILVGVVENLVRQPTSLEFTINDSTGRLKVRHYFTESGSGHERIEEGRYASVVGSARSSPFQHLGALWLWPVASADEVSYHMIEVAHAALKLRRADTRAAAEVLQTPSPSKPVLPAADAAPLTTPTKMEALPPQAAAPVAAAAPVPTLTGAQLRDKIQAFMAREVSSKGEVGVSLDEVLQHLGAVVPRETVRGQLEVLTSEGEWYTTIDDEHFAMI